MAQVFIKHLQCLLDGSGGYETNTSFSLCSDSAAADVSRHMRAGVETCFDGPQGTR